MGAVEVEPTGEDIGAGESHEGELRPVGAAANGFDLRFHAGSFHGLAGDVDDVHDGFHLFAHIIIGVVELKGDGFVAIFEIHALYQSAEHGFARFEALSVVVADDEIERGALHRSRKAGEVEETFVASGGFGDFCGGHLLHQLGSEASGVHHLVFGETGVDANAGDVDARGGCIEVFELEFADFAAVHGVSPFTAEAFDIELVSAAPDFLVGVEGHAHTTVLHFGVLHEVGHGADDFGNARFVVGAQQRVAVGNNNILADVAEQLGEFLDGGDNAGFSVEDNVRAVVVLHNARLDIGARGVGAGVDVGDEADGGHSMLHIGGECGVNIALGVHFYLF